MAKRALIIGGSGQIGKAVCRALLAAGWSVIAAQRNPAGFLGSLIDGGATAVTLDRDQPGALAAAVGGGVDVLIDTIAYDAAHARQLLDIENCVGALVVVSSASVYRDAKGRSLDEAAAGGFPAFPVPIGEDQPTVAAGPQTYSTRKVALEQTLLDHARGPVVILRPGAIHGPGSRHPREWWFVKRILDGRRVVPLAWRGESRFHTTATANIAVLCRVILAAPVTGVFNIADPEAPTVTRIGGLIGELYRHDWRLVPFDGAPVGGVGASPWSIPRPMILDLARAEASGYRPAQSYGDDLAAVCASAEAAARAGVSFPEYLTRLFDYEAEDVFIAGDHAT